MFDATVWKKENREALIQSFVDSGRSREVATVMVDAALVAAGEMTEEEANPGGHWKRQEAPGAGGPNDPSPNSMKDAQEQNKDDYK